MYVVPEASREHVRALETQMAILRRCGNIGLNVDMWDRWGSAHASDEERAQMEADAQTARSDRATAETTLTALVLRLRRDAPAAIEAWCDAHVAYLTAFIDDCVKQQDDARSGTAKYVAEQELAAWSQVRRGELPFVQENVFYVTMNIDRYRALFDVEP